ncbi:hypothetical protein ACJZ2D_015123 [Fusarium nematophilum]
MFGKKITPFLLLSPSLANVLPRGDRKVPDVDSLDWKPCDLGFPESRKQQITVPVDCATLKVPLDYTDPKSDETLDLQLVKVNATKQPAKTSVIFNPGGPGSPGVEEVSVLGHVYRDTLGGEFNIIGFDARGTGRTIPFSCTTKDSTSASNSSSLSRRNPYSGLPPQADVFGILKEQTWGNTEEYIEGCVENHKENGRFYGTAFVARDMLAIVDALNEDGLLRFWGRSYSTILGQTFAAMFPKRIGRLLMDSSLTPDDSHPGGWLSATRDPEYGVFKFFEECVKAGVTSCPMANFSGPGTTAKDLMNELSDVLEELREDPIIIPEELSDPELWYWTPGKLDLGLFLKFNLMNFVFSPASYPFALDVIDRMFARNFSVWIDPEAAAAELAALTQGQEEGQAEEKQWNLGTDAFHGIACSDSRLNPHKARSLMRSAPRSGPAQWPFEAAERYKGGFDTQIHTNFPLLFVNGRWDPITPLSGAWDASSRFNGSRLLVHEGVGHGVMKHPSNCTIQAIKNYFARGELPKVGTVCKPEKSAFKQFEDDAREGIRRGLG